MKLSRALLIVLLLHLVAVSGIIAFNAIKTRQAATVASSPSATNTAKAAVGSTIKPADSPMATTVGERATNKPVAKEIGKTDRTKKSDATKSVGDSHRTYVVAKGDNPVAIAKKFKVSYDDLLALNHIENPRKLQIGQKLLIPTKTTRSKKTNE